MLRSTINKERRIEKNRNIVSKTDLTGKIVYANKYFCEVSGYSSEELENQNHNIIRHPDMPKAIFNMMWSRLKKEKNIMAVVKNRTKDGKYYWVTTDFSIRRDIDGNVKFYMAFREKAPNKILKVIKPLYKKMLKIENEDGTKASLLYFEKFLRKKNMTYDQFIKDLAAPRGFLKSIFAWRKANKDK